LSRPVSFHFRSSFCILSHPDCSCPPHTLQVKPVIFVSIRPLERPLLPHKDGVVNCSFLDHPCLSFLTSILAWTCPQPITFLYLQPPLFVLHSRQLPFLNIPWFEMGYWSTVFPSPFSVLFSHFLFFSFFPTFLDFYYLSSNIVF